MMDLANLICKSVITLAAIGACTFLEVKALNLGIDGVYLALIIAAIAGLGGYELKNALSIVIKKVKSKNESK